MLHLRPSLRMHLLPSHLRTYRSLAVTYSPNKTTYQKLFVGTFLLSTKNNSISRGLNT